jgi:hypothetical protein
LLFCFFKIIQANHIHSATVQNTNNTENNAYFYFARRMEFIDLIRTPNIDGVRLLDKNGQVDCQGKIAITGHQLLFFAREKELIMDHKMVDAVEKETDKGRNLVKMRQKNGKLVRFLDAF